MKTEMTLGQFFPGYSILHRLDPRVKILLAIAYIVAIFLCHYVLTYAMILLFTGLLIAVSGIPFRTVLRSVRPVVVVLLFTSIINIFMTGGEHLLFSWKFLHVYEEGFWRALFMAVRVILLVISASLLLTYTTSPIDLTDALESLMTPLKWLRVPVHEFAMMMSIALRFIPTLIEETERIVNAQKSRGSDFSTGGLIRRARALVPIIVPLFISAFQRALDLATAMECRCYRGGKGRTRLKVYRLHACDLVMPLAVAALIVAICLGNEHLPTLVGWGYTL